MNMQTWTSRWWEAPVVVLAANSVVLGVGAVGNGHPEWAIATGLAPAALLIAGLALRNTWRAGATVVVAASLAAAAWWWMMYPVVLAAVVIVGGHARPRPAHRGPNHPDVTTTAQPAAPIYRPERVGSRGWS